VRIGKWIAYELIRFHPAAFAAVSAAQIEGFAAHTQSWYAVDALGAILAGPLWARGRLDDGVIDGWSHSSGCWLRRSALVAAVGLSARASGGPGEAEPDKRCAGADDRFRIVMTKGSDGPVIRRELAQQPERFKVAGTGPFQMARGPDLVEIAPDVQPQHVAWVVSGTAGRRGNGAVEAKLGQVQAGDKGIHDLDQRVGRDIVIDAGWKQADLVSRGSLNEAHGTRRRSGSDEVWILPLFVHVQRVCSGHWRSTIARQDHAHFGRPDFLEGRARI
jgi:hypothetical protein